MCEPLFPDIDVKYPCRKKYTNHPTTYNWQLWKDEEIKSRSKHADEEQ